MLHPHFPVRAELVEALSQPAQVLRPSTGSARTGKGNIGTLTQAKRRSQDEPSYINDPSKTNPTLIPDRSTASNAFNSIAHSKPQSMVALSKRASTK